MVLDSHQHFWDPRRHHYAWLTDERASIRRPFGPDDLRPVLAANGVDRTIVVEARSSLEETRELLALADATDFVAGVIGWVDLAGPDVGSTVAALRAGSGGGHLVGVRHRVREEPDPRRLLRAEVLRGLAALVDAGLVCDLLVGPRDLAAALEAARRLPDLALVIEHLGAPAVRDGADPAWAAGMGPFSDLPQVSCKVSGLAVGRSEELAPFVDLVAGWFGEDRLLFGSDWPVCLLAAGYDEILGRFRAVTAQLPAAAARRVLGANAARVYGLPDG
ncbi:MAG TPA: amidohydrolase family protein [Candidatus Dormibacteraeota bacterium]|nr:amidohydrolase family protein [Candidatus Dormibacteraeota bacterium]